MESNSYIGYIGNVIIKEYKKDKLIKTSIGHNEGTAKLFKYVANCIAGNVNNSLMPSYINIFNDSEKNPSLNTLCGSIDNTHFSTVQVREYNDKELGDAYAAEFTFMIPANAAQQTISMICLYDISRLTNTNVEQYMARIKLDSPIERSTSSTTNLVITWQLIVYNGEE